MTWAAAVRVAAGIAVGVGLATLPFLHYALEARHAANHAVDVHRTATDVAAVRH